MKEHFAHPPLGKSIRETFQQPKAVDLVDDQVIVVWKEIDSGQTLPVKDSAHPDSTKYPSYRLDVIEPSDDGQKVKLTYVKDKTNLVSYDRNQDGQTVTLTKSKVLDDADPPELGALVVVAKDDNMGNDRRERTIGTIEEVFPAVELGVEAPDYRSPGFRAADPLTTAAVTVEGQVELPQLEAGEYEKNERQITVDTKRKTVKKRGTTGLPQVQIDQRLTTEYGGGVLDVIRTLDRPGQDVDQGYTVVSSETRRTGPDEEEKESAILSGSQDGQLELTNGGGGYNTAPTVVFTGGAAGGSATGTASISELVSNDSHTTQRTYTHDGDEEGVFFFLGKLGNNGTWRNPHTNGDITLSAPFDTIAVGSFAQIVDRQPSNTYFVSRAASQLHIDLGVNRSLLCNRLSYRQRTGFGSSVRSFNIQGSNNGTDWIDLDEIAVSADADVWSSRKVKSVVEAENIPYRHFRLVRPDDGQDWFTFGELELYGVLTYSSLVGKGVTSVTITAGGHYSSTPAVTFTGGGGTGAAGTAVLVNGVVDHVTITNPGRGYTSVPAVGFTGGNGDTAEATAYIGKAVFSVTVTNGGDGYEFPPAVLFGQTLLQDVVGGGAAGEAILGYPLSEIVVHNGGTGFTSTPTIHFNGGGGTGAVGTVTLAKSVASTTMTNNGSGYTSQPTVSVSGGGGTGLTLKSYLRYTVAMVDKGSNYTSNPTVIFGNPVTGRVKGAATVTRTFPVASITTTASGSGFTSIPSVAVTPAGGDTTGSGATAVAKLGVDTAPITAGGTGYIVNDILTLVSGTSTVVAQLRVTTVAVGVITAVSVETVGNYSALPTNPVAVTGGTGTGATFSPTWKVVEYTITAPGAGYSAAPNVAVTGGGGTGATGTAVLSTAGRIETITISAYGQYDCGNPPSIRLSGGAGSGATAVASFDSPAAVDSLSIINSGKGFTSTPTLTLTGGGGTSATATATLASTYSIKTVGFSNFGTGYSSAPSITTSGGGGSGAVLQAILDTEAGGKVKSVTITRVGQDYSSVPTVIFSGGNGSGATGTVNLASTGRVIALTLDDPGTYLVAPTVSFTGGGGTGAAALYILDSGVWPKLTEYTTDDITGIVVMDIKQVVPASTRYPGSGFVDIKALDKWRSIQITNKLDLSTLPAPDIYNTWHAYTFPAKLLSVTAMWLSDSSTNSTGIGASGNATTYGYAYQVAGAANIKIEHGYSGPCQAVVVRSFLSGPPQSSPSPLIIRPSTGTILVSGNEGTRLTNSDSAPLQGVPGFVGVGVNITAHQIGPVLTGRITPATTNDFEGAVLVVDIPPSSPLEFLPAQKFLAIVNHTKWRFGIYVQELIYIIVPGNVESGGGGSS